MSSYTRNNNYQGKQPSEMTAKRNRARVGPDVQDTSMDRVVQEGAEFFKSGGGFISACTPKTRDGDQSVAMAQKLGDSTGSWQMKLDQGSDGPYPETAQNLKTKNTRKNNDGFFPG